MDTIIYTDGMRVAKIRKQKNLSQTDLAAMIGVEQPTISRIEKGADGVTLRLLRQVADALDVPLSDIFLEDDRTEAEQRLLSAYRSLPSERQQGWNDLAYAFLAGQPAAL